MYKKKVTKYGMWTLYSFETEIYAQACNVSYRPQYGKLLEVI